MTSRVVVFSDIIWQSFGKESYKRFTDPALFKKLKDADPLKQTVDQ
jgi:hypothetical protein